MKDRSFSRKIESERSFFVSEIHHIKWISCEINSMYSRTVKNICIVKSNTWWYTIRNRRCILWQQKLQM
nr:MAG TPA: hypothetical protein [Caudoviricetes sp.]